MTAAERIMKKKAHIKAEMDRAMPKAQSDELWRAATEKLDSILVRYAALPKGVRMHTDRRIFPSAAIYLTVKGVFGQREAYSIIENAAAQGCKGIAKKLVTLMRVPGIFPSLMMIVVWVLLLYPRPYLVADPLHSDFTVTDGRFANANGLRKLPLGQAGCTSDLSQLL